MIPHVRARRSALTSAGSTLQRCKHDLPTCELLQSTAATMHDGRGVVWCCHGSFEGWNARSIAGRHHQSGLATIDLAGGQARGEAGSRVRAVPKIQGQPSTHEGQTPVPAFAFRPHQIHSYTRQNSPYRSAADPALPFLLVHPGTRRQTALPKVRPSLYVAFYLL